MDITDLTNVLKTPVFWIVSAFSSVALSILGNLLTPKIAAFLASRNSGKRKAEDHRKAQFFGSVIMRVVKPERILHTKIDSLHSSLMACVFMLFALLLFAGGSALEWLLIPSIVRILISAIAVPFVWLSFYLTQEGLKWRRVATAAEKRIEAEEKLRTELVGTPELIASRLDLWDKENFGFTMTEVREIMQQRISDKTQKS